MLAPGVEAAPLEPRSISSVIPQPQPSDFAPEDTTARLRRVLDSQPRREDHAPGLARKILAPIAGGIVGAGKGGSRGAAVSSGIINEPYERAYQDWVRSVVPLQKQVELENETRRADLSGLSGVAAIMRAEQNTPENRAAIVGAEERARQPYRIDLENLRTNRAENTARIRSNATLDAAKLREFGANKRNEATLAARTSENEKNRQAISDRTDRQIQAAADRLEKSLGVRFDIAKMLADARKEAASNKNKGIQPNIERILENHATAELAQSEKFKALFKISNGKLARRTLDELTGVGLFNRQKMTKEQAQYLMEEFDDAVNEVVQETVDSARER